MKLDDIEKVHPMRQIFWASIVQICVLGFMGLSMLGIGAVFKWEKQVYMPEQLVELKKVLLSV